MIDDLCLSFVLKSVDAPLVDLDSQFIVLSDIVKLHAISSCAILGALEVFMCFLGYFVSSSRVND